MKNKKQKKNEARETKFGGKKLKDYSKQELIEVVETFIKVK